jgi:DNA-binding transcriptional LysR family regulator
MTAVPDPALAPLLDPSLVKTFLAVAEEGSISAGARRVFRTQSTASTQVRALEEQVGARLFDRDTRRLALTAEGQRFIGHARRLLLANAEALAALRTEAPTTPLRVGFSEYFQPARLAELVARLSSEWPACRFELRIAQSSVLEREFEAHRLDLVVLSKLSRRNHERGAEALQWVSARDYAMPARGEIPLVLLPVGCALHALVLQALGREKLACRVAVTCSGVAGAQAALRGGLGVGCLNEGAVSSELAVVRDERLPRLPRLAFLWRARRRTPAAEIAATLGARALLRLDPK